MMVRQVSRMSTEGEAAPAADAPAEGEPLPEVNVLLTFIFIFIFVFIFVLLTSFLLSLIDIVPVEGKPIPEFVIMAIVLVKIPAIFNVIFIIESFQSQCHCQYKRQCQQLLRERLLQRESHQSSLQTGVIQWTGSGSDRTLVL